VQILDVYEMTQDGNKPNDNVNQLDNVIGTNPGAYWESDVYDTAHFGGSGGLGLVLRLKGTHVLNELAVTTQMTDWSAESFTAPSRSAVLSGWGEPTSVQAGIDGSATFPLGAKKAGWVLLWMTDPGPSRQAVVKKLSVR
jgi:hypothetical protein